MRWPKLTAVRWPRWLTPVLVIAGLGGIGYWFYQNRAHNPVAVPAPAKADQQIELRFHDVEMQGRKDGVATWTIQAKQVDVSRDQRFAYLKNQPKGTFFNLKDWSPKEGQERTRSFDWTSREAEYDSVSNDLIIDGDVDITTDANEKLKTNRLEFRAEEERVHIPGPMDMKGEQGHPHIRADQADADLKLEVLDLKGRVRIETMVDEQQQIK